MKILIAHNSYQIRAGEDAVVRAESELLRRYGHEVVAHIVDNDAIEGVLTKVKTALRSAYSHQAKTRFLAELERTRPDVVHVHNFFPLLTPSIYDACVARSMPVVQTLHNYRTLCAAATLFRDGQVCELCIDGSAYNAVRHACYRNSRLGTLAVARMVAQHRAAGTWERKVDRFIALAEFAKAKFVAAGFPANQIAVKPNFVTVPESLTTGEREGAIFVGRLTAEKGVSILLEAWRELSVPLRLLGAGPLAGLVEDAHHPLVQSLGTVPAHDVGPWLDRSAFLVLPSIWYEACPMVCLEAMARGVPIIASDIGCIPEIVQHGITGLLFAAGSARALAETVRWAVAHPKEMAEMGVRARGVARQRYSPEASHRALMAIYEQAIEHRRALPVASRRARAATSLSATKEPAAVK